MKIKIVLHEVEHKAVKVAFLKVLDSNAEERVYIRGRPAIKHDMETLFDGLEVECNGSTRVVVHVRNVAGYRLMGVDFDDRVEHGKYFTKFFVLDYEVRSRVMCRPCCNKISKASDSVSGERGNVV